MNHRMEKVKITHGVPQGSILGPLLAKKFKSFLKTISYSLFNSHLNMPAKYGEKQNQICLRKFKSSKRKHHG